MTRRGAGRPGGLPHSEVARKLRRAPKSASRDDDES